MNPTAISESLNKTFSSNKPEGRIVFWHDDGGEFKDLLTDLTLDDVNIVHIDETPSLELKIKLELEGLTGKYLLYSTKPPLSPEKDWLIGLRLHSQVFLADLASMSVQELGLNQLSLRDHLKERLTFLKNRTRLDGLKKLVDPNDSELDIDSKMIAVVVGAAQPDLFDMLIKIMQDSYFLEELDDQQSKVFNDIRKFNLEAAFWRLIEDKFSYSKTTPRLKELLINLFVTDFVDSTKVTCPPSLAHFELQNKIGRNNATVFLSLWRNNVTCYRSYDKIAGQLAIELNVDKVVDNLDQAILSRCMTFEPVEKRLLTLIRDDLISDVNVKPDELRKLTRRRREGHWANISFKKKDDIENRYSIAYDALETASDILNLRRTYDDTISFESVESAYQSYVNSLFRMDQFYRLFHEAAKQIENLGLDLLKNLSSKIDDCYSNWYLDQLAVAWGALIKSAKSVSFLQKWKLSGVTNQYDFFDRYVKPQLSGQRTRVYVIISDAFRYEAAEELTTSLNTKYRFSASLESMLGVLPSYTALGMASLSPHTNLSFKPDSADFILVDGEPFSSLEERSKFLSKHEGVAIKATELSAMSQEKGREFVKNYRLVYVYHNTVDATGDSAATESMTFESVRKAINDLSNLVKQIINNLNATHVFVTSDHGFLYQESSPGHHDKSEIQIKPSNPLKFKKRYVLGTDLGNTPEAWTGNTSITAKTNPGMEFWIPKGRQLFNFIGGARFVHGGSMPQEIVIPVIHVKALKGTSAKDTIIKKVGVHLLTDFQKMVTNSQKLEFIQTESVTERRKPNILRVSLRDGDKLISNEVILTFDSASETLEDRKRTAIIKIVSGDYDPKREYALVLRDEDDIEYSRYPVRVDISFRNDF
jgi:uncharacterized protein (TIGR02687 family)